MMKKKGGNFHDLIQNEGHNYDYYTLVGVESYDTLDYHTSLCNEDEKFQNQAEGSFVVVEVDGDDFAMPAN